MDHVPGITAIAERDISLEMVQEMMHWFKGLQSFSLGHSSVTPSLVMACASTLVDVHSQKKVKRSSCRLMPPEIVSCVEPPAWPTAEKVLLVDYSNFEAVASAKILQTLLVPLFHDDLAGLPYILPSFSADTFTWARTTAMILLCTSGVFHNEDVLLSICKAGDVEMKVIPILADERFRFPTAVCLQELRVIVAKATSLVDSCTFIDVDMALKAVSEIFIEIAIFFQPDHITSTEAVLQTKARELFDRLSKQGVSRKASKSRNSSLFLR